MTTTRRRRSAVVWMRRCRTVAVMGAFVSVICDGWAPDLLAQTPNPQSSTVQAAAATPQSVTCASKMGERISCAADTSAGIVLMRSTGEGPCLLGKTWGYDQASVWVSDGCSGEFATGRTEAPATKAPAPRHVPNAGFLLFDGEKGQVYFRLFSYGRYLNQRNLNESY